VNDGVPVHVGATLNTCGGAATDALADLQQICPVQSLSTSHDFGHVLAHVPLQQSCDVPEQSAEVVHDFGHGSYCGLRQSPVVFRFGSTTPTEVQQT
jgi:hypothetical protein